MNELDKRFVIGDEVEGEIFFKIRDFILVLLVGYKSDGVIFFFELLVKEDLIELVEKFNVGDIIKVKVIKF